MKLKNLSNFLKSNFLYRIGVIILSLIIFFFLGYYGKKQYEQVQKEMLLDENKLIDENK